MSFQLTCEKARLATWLNGKRATDTPPVAMIRYLAEAELAGKGLQIGPFGSESTFTTPSLNVFI